MDMLVLSLFLLSTSFTVCVVGHTCPTADGSVECRDDQYCCSGCCDSTGFLALYLIAAIGATPILLLAIYVIIVFVKMCFKRGKPVAPLEEKTAPGSMSDVKSIDGDKINSEENRSEPSTSEDKAQPTEDKASVTHAKTEADPQFATAENAQSSASERHHPTFKTGSSDDTTSPPSEDVLYKGPNEMIISMPPSSPSGSTSHA